MDNGGATVGEGDTDLTHLHPAIRSIARPPAEERIRHVRADRWIGYPRATAALDRLEALHGWPGRQRMPNLLLIGPTNNGKSMIIEKFRRTHPPISHPDREEIPVLVVQMLRPRQRIAELRTGHADAAAGRSGCGCWWSTSCTTCSPAPANGAASSSI